MLDLRRVRTLREVAARGTISAAADALHLTASAASQQLAALEKEVGRPLLEPDGRSVRLTPAARVLLGHADRIFAELEELEADLAAADRGEAGTLRVGSFASGVIALVAPAAGALRGRRPGLAVEVADLEVVQGLELLGRRELDVLITMESLLAPGRDDPRYTRVELLSDPMDAVLPSGHPLLARRRRASGAIPLEALAVEPFVMPPAAWSCADVVIGGCQAAGFTPQAAHRAGDWAAGLALVRAGLGVAMLPRMAELTPPEGVVITPVEPAPLRHIIAVTRRGAEEHPHVRAMLEELQRLAALRVADALGEVGRAA